MRSILLWCLMLLAVFLPLLPAIADDDDPEGGGGALTPALSWQMACTVWDRREYAQAAALYASFAEKNPDDGNALEARWRVYQVFQGLRPNPDRRKKAYNDAMDSCDHWVNKFTGKDKEKAASAYWYRALILEREQGRPAAISMLQDLVNKYPDTNIARGANGACWYLSEWLKDAQRWPEAVQSFQLYRKMVAGVNNDWFALGAYREGNIDETLGNKADAIDAYKLVLVTSCNWGWDQIYWNGLDVGRRLKKMGETELAREFFLKIIDKCDPNWDVTRQAHLEMGEAPDTNTNIWCYPHIYPTYTGHAINLTAETKMDVEKAINVLWRPLNVTAEKPYKGTMTITPKVEMTKTPDNLKAIDTDGKKSYTTDLNIKGDGDLWHNSFVTHLTAPPPDGLEITRKWEKAGNTWGECTIRIKSSAYWDYRIYLPNTKTNVDNFNNKPNEVNDNGASFRWYAWYDLSQGVTIKFPVETDATEYYPKIRLEHGGGGGGYSDKHITGKTADYDMKEMSIKLSSEKEYPYHFSFPGNTLVYLDEVKK